MTATTPPSRSSIDVGQARRQAKELLAAARSGDPDAARTLRRPAPRLADAQHAAASGHGSPNCADLVRDHESYLPAYL